MPRFARRASAAVFAPLALLLLALLLTSPAAARDGETIVDVITKDRADIARLANLGLDLAENAVVGATTVVATPETLALLDREGFRYRPNARMTRASLRTRFRAADAGRYHTVAESAADLAAIAKAHPRIARVESIGKSFEGRDILALRLSGAPARRAAKVPRVLFMGLTHAREWISAEVPHAIADALVSGYGKDPKITALVDGRVIWIVPIVNPDGLDYSQTASSYWRKNRNDNNGNRYKGVDLNRNYGYKFGLTGASASPSSDTYHGTEAFSEPCTRAIKALAEREKFTASISYHSYGDLVLYPFGYGYNIPNPDRDVFVKLAKGMAALNGYSPKNSADLYPAMGDSDDWLYGAMGCLAFTFELGDEFIPDESLVDGICAKNVKAALHLLDQAGTVAASTHPARPRAVAERAARLTELARAAERAAAAAAECRLERDALVALLDPANDPDGARLEEYLKAWSRLDAAARDAHAPVLAECRARVMAAAEDGRLDRADGARRLDRIQSALGE